jgi:hypothetical protein
MAHDRLDGEHLRRLLAADLALFESTTMTASPASTSSPKSDDPAEPPRRRKELSLTEIREERAPLCS